MKKIRQVIRNERGLSLIPVLMVSMVLVSLLSVWMIQFGNKSSANSVGWVQKENFRVGTELAKQVGEAYESYRQQSGCSGGILQNNAGVSFCFPHDPYSSGTGACATSPLMPTGSKICVRVITKNMRDQLTAPLSNDESTFVATYVPPTRSRFWLSTAHATPLGAPVPPSTTNSVTAIDCSPNPTTPQCHSCGGSTGFNCYQIAYCSVIDPNCSGGTSMVKLGIMVKTN